MGLFLIYFELPGREWDDNLINGKHVFLPDLPEKKCMVSGNIKEPAQVTVFCNSWSFGNILRMVRPLASFFVLS